MFNLFRKTFVAVADPEGQFGATAPPNGCGTPLQWRPFWCLSK